MIEIILAALLSLIYGLSRVWLALQTNLWYDEAYTYVISHLDLAGIITASATDVHPPLYYIILSLFSWADITSIRAVSVLIALCSWVGFLFLMEDLRLSIKAQLLAAVMFILAPFNWYYGQELRMYGLLELLVICQALAWRRRNIPMLTLASIAAVYTHNYGLIYTAVVYLWALYDVVMEHRKPTEETRSLLAEVRAAFADVRNALAPSRNLIISGALVALAYLPWVFYALLPQLQFVESGHHWLRPFDLGNAIMAFYTAIYAGWADQYGTLWLVVMTTSGLAALYFRADWRKPFYWLSLAPFVLAMLISANLTNIMLGRALLPCMPFLYMGIADQLTSNRGRYQVMGSLVVISVLGLSLWNFGGAVVKGELHPEELDPTITMDPGLQIIHLEDTSLATFGAYHPYNVHRILSDCPEQIAALGQAARDPMEFYPIAKTDLPEHYYFVGNVGIFSLQCHADLYKQMTEGAELIQSRNTQAGYGGVWKR